MDDFDELFSALALSEQEVAELSVVERERRVDDLIAESFRIYDYAVRVFGLDRGKSLKATVALFSGGNDSTFLLHLFRDVVDTAVHINTTIGIEQTRQFVRDTCVSFGVPLLEKSPPVSYRDLVLEMGFPGPSLHYIMYQRLKERALRLAHNELIDFPRREVIVYLAGRRRTESHRRAAVPFFERDGARVWCSAIVNWTKLDIATYRARFDWFPSNPVSDMLHMSGECLCGAFAGRGEFDELKFFFPEVAEMIHDLEHEVAECANVPDYRKQWGWGSYPQNHHRSRRKVSQDVKSGPLCSSCEFRMFGDD